MNASTDQEDKCVEAAVAWIKALRTPPDESTADAFADWIRASPQHLRAYLRQAAIDDALQISGVAANHSAVEWTALEDEVEDEDAPEELVAAAPPTSGGHMAHTERFPWLKATAAGALCASVAALALWWEQWSWTPYSASADMPREVTLEDESVVTLYAGSTMRVRYVLWWRDVELLRGGATFQVHHDSGRSFTVNLRSGRVEALGTRFNVLWKDSGAGVHVSDGKVQLVARGRVPLSAGQSANLTRGGLIVDIRMGRTGDRAGESPKEFFRYATLESIAETINSYNRVPQIKVVGRARNTEYTGTLVLDEPRAWVSELKNNEKLRFKEDGAAVEIDMP